MYSLCEECFGVVKLNEKIKIIIGLFMYLWLCIYIVEVKVIIRVMIFFKGKLKVINEVEIFFVIFKIFNIM